MVDDKGYSQTRTSFKPNRIIGLFLGVAIGTAISGAALYIMFGLGDAGTSDKSVTVVPSPGPYKQKPTEPGGLTIKYQDKCIYNSFGGQKSNKCVDSESLLSKEPVNLPSVAEETGLIDEINMFGETQPLVQNRSTSKKFDDRYFVQLGAFSKKAVAESFWEDIRVSNIDLLAKYDQVIVEVDLRDKGVLYRLRVGPIESKEPGELLCNALISRGLGCLVTVKD